MYRAQGDLARATHHYGESLALYRALDHPAGIAALLHNLGQVRLEQGDPAAATLFSAGLSLLRDLEEKRLIGLGLAGLAAALAARGQAPRAARLFGAAESVLETQGRGLEPADRLVFLRQRAVVREQLDQASWAAAWEAGRVLPLAAAVTEALDAAPPG